MTETMSDGQAVPQPANGPGLSFYLTSRVISVAGDGVTMVALPFAVLASGGSAGDIGIVLAARTVPLILLLVFGGVVADRLPRGRLLVGADIAAAAAQLTMAVLVTTGSATVWNLAAAYGLFGAVQAVARPASSGVLPQLVRADRLQQANATLGMVTSIATVAGTAVGGLLVAVAGPDAALYIDGTSFLVSAALVSRIRFASGTLTATASLRSDLAQGWSYVRAHGWVAGGIAYFAFYQFAVLSAVYVLGPIIAAQSLRGAADWGLLLACSGAGSIAGGALLLRYKPARQLVAMYLSLLAAVPLLVLLGVAPTLPLLAVSQFLFGASLAFAGALWFTALQQQVPGGMLGRVSAYDLLGSTALRPVGLAVIGPLAAAAGLRVSLIGVAVSLTVLTVAALCLPANRQLRDPHRTTGPAAPAEPSTRPSTLTGPETTGNETTDNEICEREDPDNAELRS